MTPSEEKAALRRWVRAERKTLDPALRAQWDAEAVERVTSLPEYAAARTVFCYVAMKYEVQTRAILERVWRDGKRLAVPRCLADGIMEAVELTSMTQLSKRTMGILEPDDGLPVVPFDEIDFAVVPALAYTPDGRRLGQGGGYYDRFMAEARAFTCGVCYPCFLLPDVPCEPHDRRVMRVVAPGAPFVVDKAR